MENGQVLPEQKVRSDNLARYGYSAGAPRLAPGQWAQGLGIKKVPADRQRYCFAPVREAARMHGMQKAGVDPEEDLSFYTIPPGSFKHEKVIYGVFFERYDAGSIPIDDLETMVADDRVAMDDFNIIARNEPIPYCNFGVTQKVDEAFAEKFKKTVLAITPDDTVELNGEVVKVLDRALVEGYVDIKDSDFDIVRDMAKRTNMPPYQKF